MNSDRFYLLSEITEQDIQEVLDMEEKVYSENEQQTLERCKQFFTISQDIYLFFKDRLTERIVGSISYLPVTPSCYTMIKSGKFIEKDIVPCMIRPYSDLVYFSGIIIKEDYRNSGLLRLMLKEFIHRTQGMGQIIADAVTNEGARLCKLFGMDRIRQSDHNSIIYEKILM